MFEVLQLQPQKNVQSDRIYVSLGTGNSLAFMCSSKAVRQHTELTRWLSFWLTRPLISAPMLGLFFYETPCY